MQAIERRKQRGQGMTEYIIIVALIAIAAIGVYTYFGATVRNQTAGIAAGLAGQQDQADKAVDRAKTAATKAVSNAETNRNLSNFTQDTAPGASR